MTRKKDPNKVDLNKQLQEIEIKKTALKKIVDELNKNIKSKLNMKTLIFIIALLTTISVNAQWTTNTDLNTLVVETPSDNMQAIGTSDGHTYIVFWKVVPAPTNFELRMQVLDQDGRRKFGDEGILITNTVPMSSYVLVFSLAVDNDDNLYVGITSSVNTTGRVFKLDMQGNQLWGADGLTISGVAYSITFLPLQSGDIIMSWGTGSKALMQKYDANGNAIWAATQQVISGTSKTWPGNLFELSGGYFELIFHTYNFGTSSTLRAQKYDSNGTAQWATPTQLSNKTTAYNVIYSVAQDGDAVFIGYKGSGSGRFDSYLQRINPDGTLPWGINGMDFDVNQTNYENDTKIAYFPGSQYVWSVCTYSNTNQSLFGEYVQKFDKTTGARQFSNNAKMVYPISADTKVHSGPLFLIDDQPFFLMKAGQDNGATPTTLNALLLNENGDFAWPQEYFPVATYTENKSRITLTKTVGRQSVALFVEDKSDGKKIYAQNFLQPLPTPEPPVEFSALANGANIDLSWIKNANSNDVIVSTNMTNSFDQPVSGTQYPVGNTIGSNGTVIYQGPLSGFTHANHLPLTTYYYKIWSVVENTTYSTSGLTTNATTPFYHHVCIPAGWSAISSFLVPTNPAIENVLAEITDDLQIILKSSGLLYWPGQNINTFGDWVVSQGYKIRMNQSACFNVFGEQPDNKTITTPAGLSYLPVLCDEIVPANDIFSQLGSNLRFAYDLSSQKIYWPNGGIFTLNDLEPGKGYLISMMAAGQATYSCSKSGIINYAQAQPEVYENAPWQVNNTGSVHLISITQSALEGLSTGDFIGVFDAQGKCAGITQYKGESGNLPLLAFGNDITTGANDGLADGETMSFRIYRSALQYEAPVQASFSADMPNAGAYTESGQSKIVKFGDVSTGITVGDQATFSIHPNPGSGNFIMNIPVVDQKVLITVVNMASQVVYSEMIDGQSSSANHQLNLTSLKPGIYFVKVSGNQKTLITKLIVQ